MKLFLNKTIIFSLTLILIANPAFASTKKHKAHAHKTHEHNSQPQISSDNAECKAELLLNAETGEVISERNSHEPLRPASMVKLMLTWVVFHQIESGHLHFEDKVKASARASKIGGSQVYLKENEEFTVEELLKAVLIQSANDAAVALAEHIGGNVEGFVEMMNTEAKKLGMQNSTFYFPHGLPPSKGQKPDLVSADDFGILSRNLIKKYPKILEFTSKDVDTFRAGSFEMRTHNHLLHDFAGCDGLKTGYYSEAGYSISATAKRNDKRLIAVVMNCPTRRGRDEEVKKLFAKGFRGE